MAFRDRKIASTIQSGILSVFIIPILLVVALFGLISLLSGMVFQTVTEKVGFYKRY